MRSIRHLAATALASTMLVTGIAGAAAQDATPSSGLPERGLAYPVSIHEGTCESPVAEPIGPTIDTEVAGFGEDATMIGVTTQAPVLTASTEIDASFDDLTGTPHVVAVHASSEDYGNIVACGEIAGYHDNNRIVFVLGNIDDSEVAGIGILDDAPSVLEQALETVDHAEWLDDGTLHLTIYVIPGAEPQGDA